MFSGAAVAAGAFLCSGGFRSVEKGSGPKRENENHTGGLTGERSAKQRMNAFWSTGCLRRVGVLCIAPVSAVGFRSKSSVEKGSGPKRENQTAYQL